MANVFSALACTCLAGAWVLACAEPRASVGAPENGAGGTPAVTSTAGMANASAAGAAAVAGAAGAASSAGGAASSTGGVASSAGEAPSTGAAGAAASSSDADTEVSPLLLGRDGTPLPQTHERPSTDSPGFRLRLERLVDAIANDDPERALPAFFPRVAYEQVKAIAEPARDWQQRLVRAFQRDIHEYHRQLGSDAAGARLAGLTTNERAVRWMDPGAEGNKTGYYRVTRSRLRLLLSSGAVRELPLTSLISWRGAWYVVHLNGFS